MDKYTAVFGQHNGRIISVGATDTADAVAKIAEQLQRPGRYDIYQRWVQDGRKMIVNDDGTRIVQTMFDKLAAHFGNNYQGRPFVKFVVTHREGHNFVVVTPFHANGAYLEPAWIDDDEAERLGFIPGEYCAV